MSHWINTLSLLLALGLSAALPAQSGSAGKDKPEGNDKSEKEDSKKKPDFPPWNEVSKDYKEVVSTADGQPSLYSVWLREKDQQMLAELPNGFAGQRHYIALTVPTGELFAGLQAGDFYVYWKRFGTRIALVVPNLGTRSTGDTESKDSVSNHFTDTVLADMPIVCMGPKGQPVIDLDDLLINNATVFYGGQAKGKTALATIVAAKAFPKNIEISIEMPAGGGSLKTFHYSISLIPEKSDYKPRAADDRVGYFTTQYRDLGKFNDDDVDVRYINRWRLEKAVPNLRISPAKEPITFYLEHTVPARYRRWVKQGVLMWNEAFEKVGISDAIVVHYQDKASGAHMEKDPEDVRYNFIRWLSNDVGLAIGPSRAHPLTGEILDADIVLTDGWIRHFWNQYNKFLPEAAMEGFDQETMAWLDAHPDWDPRIRLAEPAERARLLTERATRMTVGPVAWQHALGDGSVLESPALREMASVVGPNARLCTASGCKGREMAVMGLAFDVLGLLADSGGGDKGEEKDEEKDEKKKEPDNLIDGIPEDFLGPMLADLVCHETGHTLGLRHNFKASGAYTMAEINSKKFKGQKPNTGSVMDYNPVNINMDDGEIQGDWTMIGVGPYDMWAIEYGYTFGDTKDILKRVSEPELAYLSDEDTSGPDPLARRYDFAKNPLDYCKSRMRLVKLSRQRILEKFVKEGDSWSKARQGYEITLGEQMASLSIMANWIGGASVNRDKKGDPGNRRPIEVVSVDQQRAALDFVIENAFNEAGFGLNEELLAHMSVDKWRDRSDPTWPIHDRIAGVQSSALSMLMNPTRLRRVYDNELYLPAAEDALTLPEVLKKVDGAIWAEVGLHAAAKESTGEAPVYTTRKPMISSLRRALQRDHLERLIDLTLEGSSGAAGQTVAVLATQELRELQASIKDALAKSPDAYTKAHLTDAAQRIEKALDATYFYGGAPGGGGGVTIIQFGKEGEQK